MLAFLKKILLFTFIFSLLLLLPKLITDQILNQKASFKLSKTVKLAVFGHSHPECAFNDSLMPSVVNLAKSGESYFYTYYKMKEVLEDNPELKTVWLELSNNTIVQEQEEWIWGDQFLFHRYTVYAPFISWRDQMTLVFNNPKAFIGAYVEGIRKNLTKLRQRAYLYAPPDIGGYLYTNKSHIDSLIQVKKDKPKFVQSDILLKYLDRIVALCKEKNVDLCFVRSPMHKEYLGYVYEKEFIDLIESKYKEVPFLDLSNFPLKDSEYRDLEHLNYLGATNFSIWVQNQIDKGLLDAKDRVLFVKKELRYLED